MLLLNYFTFKSFGILKCIVLLALLHHVKSFYTESSDVISLTSANFDNKIKGKSIAVVEFYAPWCGHCKSFKPTYESVATALKNIISVAAVDCDNYGDLAQKYGVNGFPTVKLFYTDNKSNIKSIDYQGNRTPQDLINWTFSTAKKIALKKISSSSSNNNNKSRSSNKSNSGNNGKSGFYSSDSSVINLSDSNFEDKVKNDNNLWLIEFYAPWCGHCKNLKSDWEQAATELRDKVNVGAVNCDEEKSLCSEYGIKGFPTLFYFGNDKDSPEAYQGDREASSIVEFALSKWSVNAPVPEIYEIYNNDIFEKECHKLKQICFIAFLPDIIESKASGRNKLIEMLEKVAEDYKERPYAYFWTEGTRQGELEKCFGVGGYGYPAFIAYTPQKNKYASMKSGMDYGHVTSFIQSLRQGYEKLFPLENENLNIKNIEKWDGQDAQEEIVDEFNLDEIMNEEL